jgi:flagellar biosynthetic protein FliR
MIDDISLFFYEGKFIIGLLIFVRVGAMMAAAPLFKNSAIQPALKVVFAIILATTITTAYYDEQPAIDFQPWYLAFLVLKEVMAGLIFGFAANIIFFAARMAGGLMDTDMGFQTSLLFNMDAGTPTLLGELKELVALIIFLIINGHHYLIGGIFLSLKVVPLTTFAISEASVGLLLKMATSVLAISLKIAAPVLLSLFVTNLALALLGRVAPQTNIFILSFQAKVAVGLLVLLASAPLFIYVIKQMLEGVEESIYQLLLTLNGAG